MAENTNNYDPTRPFPGMVPDSNIPMNEAPAPPMNNHNFGVPAGDSFTEHQFWPIAAEQFAFQYPLSTVGTDEVFRATDQWLQHVCTLLAAPLPQTLQRISC
jgi:hypothetical protein